jgi:hypothetical protein
MWRLWRNCCEKRRIAMANTYVAARENERTPDEAAEDAKLHIEGARGPAPTIKN